MKNKLSYFQKALNTWSIILIIWALYRANIKGVNPLLEEIFIKFPLFFFFTFYFYKKVGLNFTKELYLKKKIIANTIIGVILGMLIFISMGLAVWMKTHTLKLLFSISITTIVISLLSAISEETLNKGLILKQIYKERKGFLIPVIYSSILFIIIRIPYLFTQPLKGEITLFILFLDFILGIVTSIFFLLRKTLIIPIFIHFFYTLFLINFI